MVGDLTEVLHSAQKMLRDTGGEIALRRLNCREYEATVKELLGIRIMADGLPDDPSGRFDTIGQNQSLSSIDLENYFADAWSSAPRCTGRCCYVRVKWYGRICELWKDGKEIYEILEKVQEV